MLDLKLLIQVGERNLNELDDTGLKFTIAKDPGTILLDGEVHQIKALLVSQFIRLKEKVEEKLGTCKDLKAVLTVPYNFKD